MSEFDRVEPQVAAMRNELADRELALRTKSGLLMAAGGVLGAVGAAVLVPSLLPELAMHGVILGGAGGFMAGSAAGDYLTTVDRSKLEVDRRILDANINNISNRGYWNAYNTQVVQANAGDLGRLPSPPMVAAPPPIQGPHRAPPRVA